MRPLPLPRLPRPALAAAPALLASALVPGAALAQWNETTSAADVELFRNRAEVSVMVTLENPTERAIQAELGFSIGSGTATGLAMLSPFGENTWRKGELDRGEAALDRYLRMSTTPVASSPLSALLSWTGAGYVDLRTSIPALGAQAVSYQFIAPVTYDGGLYKYEMPALDPSVAGFVNVRLADKNGTLTIDDVPAEGGVGRVRIDSSHAVTYAVPTTEPVLGDIAVLPTKEGQALVDFKVDLSPHLAEVPEHAQIIVLLDGSRSISANDGLGSLAAARSYLNAFDQHDAHVALVTFDRTARVIGADPAAPFVPSDDAITTLRTMTTLPRANGSNLDVALAKATELLASVTGPKRVVLFTDLATADRLVPNDLVPKVPPGAILHIAQTSHASATLSRDDDTEWAVVPRSTGGLAWIGAAMDDDADARAVFEELARPKRLDRARISPSVDGTTELGSLPEGTRFASASIRAPEGYALTVDGELWSQPFHKVFATTTAYRRLAAAFVFGNGIHEQLDAETQFAFASLAHVVSPVTSLVTKDAANAPFDLESFGTGGFGGSGGYSTSCACGIHDAQPPKLAVQFDPKVWLEREIRPIVVACDPTGAPTIDVESTRDEIVDVHVNHASSAAASTCISDGVWGVTLGEAFRSITHTTISL